MNYCAGDNETKLINVFQIWKECRKNIALAP